MAIINWGRSYDGYYDEKGNWREGFLTNRGNAINEYFNPDTNPRHNDWTDFFRALGVVEGGSDTYGAKNNKGYYGIYQIGEGVLTDVKLYSRDGNNLNVHNVNDFLRNPIAQEIAALKEFSGLETGGCSSKYTATNKQLKKISAEETENGIVYYDLDNFLGQEFIVYFSNGIEETVKFTQAGISAAAHLIGQGRLAEMLNKVLLGETIDVNDYRAADGNGIAFTVYMQLFKDYDLSPLIAATTKEEYNNFLKELLQTRKQEILGYVNSHKYQTILINCKTEWICQLFTTAITSVDPQPTGSPLVLDLDGDGVETTSVNDGSYFDHDANGFAEQTGWASSDDGLLAWDRNGDGIINDGKELFGNETLLQSGYKASNGFQALAEWDDNLDGKIDSNDSIWSNLKIWQDYDGDGYSSADELQTLSELGILSINTDYTDSSYIDPQENEHRQVGSFSWSDGTTGTASDVWFKADKMYTIANEWLDVPEDIAVLPDLQGYGNVYDLHQAIVRDMSGELKTLVESFIAETDPSIRNSLMEQILFKWTGSEGIDPGSRGENIDARKLAVLGKFFGEDFVQSNNTNPNFLAAPWLNKSYRGIFEMFYAGLMAQTHLKDFYDKIIFTWDEGTQSLRGDLSEVITELQNRIAIDPVEGKEVLGEFARTLCGFDAEDMVDYVSFRNTFSAQSEELGWVIDTAGNVFMGTVDDDSIFANETPDHLYGYGGNDILYGMDGDDLIEGGDGTDSLYGGMGNDLLNGGEGNDCLSGDAGNDTYLFGRGSGQDTICNYDDSAGKVDTIQFASGVLPSDVKVSCSGDNLVLSIDGTMDQLTVGYYFYNYGNSPYRLEQVRFSDGTVWDISTIKAKAIIGTESSDWMKGYETDDVISGLGGDDTIYGDIGNDTLDGGAGSNYLFGEAGDDTLRGGADYDYLDGGDGNDTLYGQAGGDYLSGDDGDDLLIGGADNDSLYGGSGADTLDGGEGNDYLYGDYGNDTYLFGRGSGQDTILEYDPTPENMDTLRFSSDVARLDVEMIRSGDDMVFRIKGTWDQVLVKNWMYDPYYQVERVEFGDGVVLTAQEVTDSTVDIYGTLGDDYIYGSRVMDRLYGYGGNDTIYGNAGDDLLDGGPGNDYLQGDTGSDVYLFGRGSGQDTIWNYDESVSKIDAIQFSSDVLPSDVRVSRSGDNLVLSIDGTTDQLTVGYYFYNYSNSPYRLEQVRFSDGTVWDVSTIKAKAMIGTEGSNWLKGYEGDDVISGLGGDDTIYGDIGNDTLDGGAGSDYLFGEAGDDTLRGGEGNDWLIDGEGNNTLYGGSGYDYLQGGAGADTLDGGPDNDYLYGDYGNDLYLFGRGSGQDTVYDYDPTSGNLDTLRFSSDVIPSDVVLSKDGENLIFSINGTSDKVAISNHLYSNDYKVELMEFWDGSAFNLSDIQFGTSANDTLTGTSSDSILIGDAGNDTLSGGAGNDLINGGLGADNMSGGLGNDIFIVDNTGDKVTEGLNEGADTVYSSVTYSLGANIENLTLIGTSAINGTGNALGNVLMGNSGANKLTGGAGNDTYVVGSGDTVVEKANEGTDMVKSSVTFTLPANVENLTLIGTTNINATGNTLSNILIGNSGNNTLSGGAGADKLIGGLGNDTYVVDNTNDVVTEALNEGTDTVQSSITYTLGSNLENLTLTGTSAINGTGNTLSNVLTGNSGANILTGYAGDDTLNGGAGADKLIGGLGNDTYVVDNTNDVVTEALNEGTDTVQSSITYTLGSNLENLTLTGTSAINGTGNTLNNVLTGNSGANVLSGGSGEDTLSGGAGNDTLDGGTGADTLDGGLGNDTLKGGVGNDLYLFGRGSGQDKINDYDTTAGNNDKVKFGSGVNPIDLIFVKDGNDLKAQIYNSSDLLTIQNQNLGAAYQVEVFEANDGRQILSSKVALLIQEMAGFSAQTGMSWTQLIEQRPQDVQMILAQYWQPSQ